MDDLRWLGDLDTHMKFRRVPEPAGRPVFARHA